MLSSNLLVGRWKNCGETQDGGCVFVLFHFLKMYDFNSEEKEVERKRLKSHTKRDKQKVLS